MVICPLSHLFFNINAIEKIKYIRNIRKKVGKWAEACFLKILLPFSTKVATMNTRTQFTRKMEGENVMNLKGLLGIIGAVLIDKLISSDSEPDDDFSSYTPDDSKADIYDDIYYSNDPDDDTYLNLPEYAPLQGEEDDWDYPWGSDRAMRYIEHHRGLYTSGECPICDAQLEFADGSFYCPHCGAQITEDEYIAHVHNMITISRFDNCRFDGCHDGYGNIVTDEEEHPVHFDEARENERNEYYSNLAIDEDYYDPDGPEYDYDDDDFDDEDY